MKPLETERLLLLRPFVVDDCEALHREIYSDLEVVRDYSGLGVLTLDQTRQHLVELAFAFGRRHWGKGWVTILDNKIASLSEKAL